jgi:hypothetical protein
MREDSLVGRTVRKVRLMTRGELARYGWEGQSSVCLELDDGSVVYSSRDEEGNGPGCLLRRVSNKEHYIAVCTQKSERSINELVTDGKGPDG